MAPDLDKGLFLIRGFDDVPKSSTSLLLRISDTYTKQSGRWRGKHMMTVLTSTVFFPPWILSSTLYSTKCHFSQGKANENWICLLALVSHRPSSRVSTVSLHLLCSLCFLWFTLLTSFLSAISIHGKPSLKSLCQYRSPSNPPLMLWVSCAFLPPDTLL